MRNRATLDVIGLAGFGVAFDSIKHQDNILANAFKKMFASSQNITALAILQNFFPIFKLIVSWAPYAACSRASCQPYRRLAC